MKGFYLLLNLIYALVAGTMLVWGANLFKTHPLWSWPFSFVGGFIIGHLAIKAAMFDIKRKEG